MRNVALVGRESFGPGPNEVASPSHIEAVSIDPVTNAVFAAGSEPPAQGAAHAPGGNVRFWLWQLASSGIQGQNEDEESVLVRPMRIILPAPPVRLGRPDGPPHSTQLLAPPDRDAQVVSLQFLQDGGSLAQYGHALCMITSGGDIVVAPTGEEAGEARFQPDVVGTIEQGISAAAWSPDEEFLAVVTMPSKHEKEDGSVSWIGEKILVMSREFEVLREQTLATDEFGEGTSLLRGNQLRARRD